MGKEVHVNFLFNVCKEVFSPSLVKTFRNKNSKFRAIKWQFDNKMNSLNHLDFISVVQAVQRFH